MITTIQVHDSVKNQLDRMKTDKETYEEIIIGLMRIVEKCKREKEQLLIEGCKEMAEDSLRITKEWEKTDSEIDWEW